MKILVRSIERIVNPEDFQTTLRGYVYIELSGEMMEEFFGENQQYEDMLKSVNDRDMKVTSQVFNIPNEILHEALRETIENMVVKKL